MGLVATTAGREVVLLAESVAEEQVGGVAAIELAGQGVQTAGLGVDKVGSGHGRAGVAA